MPAGATYEPLATTTLSSSQASITFNSVSGSYTDLKVVLVGSSSTGTWWGLRFNSDTGTNYSYTNVRGNGSTVSTNRTTNGSFILANENNISSISHAIYEIFSYASTSINKTVLGIYSGDAVGSGIVQRTVGLWRSTAAITTVEIWTTGGANFAIGTTATLYGIARA